MLRKTFPALALIALVSCGGALPGADSGLPPAGKPIELVGPDAFAGATVFAALTQMALTEDYVVFTVPWLGVYRIPKYGGEKAAIRADDAVMFNDVAATRDTVVWTEGATAADSSFLPVKVMRQTGGEAPVTLVEMSPIAPVSYAPTTRLQISGDVVYMYGAGSGVRGIFSVPLAGGALQYVAEVQDLVPNEQPFWHVADGYIYYLPRTNQPDNCALSRVSVAGGTPEVLSQPCSSPAFGTWWIGAVDETNVYLAALQEIWTVPKQGGTPTLIYSKYVPGNVIISDFAMQVDAEKLYFVLNDVSGGHVADTVVWIPTTGGDPTPIAAGFDRDSSGGYEQLLQDANNLFLRTGQEHIVVARKTPPAP